MCRLFHQPQRRPVEEPSAFPDTHSEPIQRGPRFRWSVVVAVTLEIAEPTFLDEQEDSTGRFVACRAHACLDWGQLGGEPGDHRRVFPHPQLDRRATATAPTDDLGRPSLPPQTLDPRKVDAKQRHQHGAFVHGERPRHVNTHATSLNQDRWDRYSRPQPGQKKLDGTQLGHCTPNNCLRLADRVTPSRPRTRSGTHGLYPQGSRLLRPARRRRWSTPATGESAAPSRKRNADRAPPRSTSSRTARYPSISSVPIEVRRRADRVVCVPLEPTPTGQ